MEIKEYLQMVLGKKKLVAYFVLVFFTISAVFTAIQPFEYAANMRFIAVQTFERELEPYSIAKSNQYLSSIISNVVTSNSFYDKIIDSGFNVNKDYFYSFNKSEIERWREVVKVGAVDDTGIINLQVLHTDKYQAEEILKALAETVKNNIEEYYKVEHTVEIKVLDKVQVSSLPVKPNVVLNLGFGIVFGLLAGLCYIYVFVDKFQKSVEKRVVSRNGNNTDRESEQVKFEKDSVEKIAKEVASAQREVSEIARKDRWQNKSNIRKQFVDKNKQGRGKRIEYSRDDYNKIVKKGDIKNLFG